MEYRVLRRVRIAPSVRGVREPFQGASTMTVIPRARAWAILFSHFVAASPHRPIAVSPHALSPFRPFAVSPFRPIAISGISSFVICYWTGLVSPYGISYG